MNTPDERPIVSAEWLVEHLDSPNLVIIDTRKENDPDTFRIPGAQKLSIDRLLHHSGQVISPDLFSQEMSRLGIGSETLVVTYDDGNNLFGARLWWVLRYFGHDRVRVLDGGWSGWVAEGRPVSDVSPAAPQPVIFEPQVVPGRLAETAEVAALIDDASVQLLDVRGDSEWFRQAPTEKSMAGHVPGARHLVWSETIDPGTHRFLPANALQASFTRAGLTPDTEVIVYCQGGIRAAHALLALSLAGFNRVRNYEGSWSEWSIHRMPAVVEPAQRTHSLS